MAQVYHFQNFYVTRLREALGSSSTTIYVDIPPTITSGILVLEGNNVSKREIIYFSSVSGYALNDCVRGLEGTIPNTHNQGATVEQSVTAGQLDQVLSPHILLQGLGNDENAAMSQDAITRVITEGLYPVGSTYFNKTNSTNPATLLGFGTWVRLEGVVLGGRSETGGSPFNVAAGTVIGADTHTLTIEQMPSHGHERQNTDANWYEGWGIRSGWGVKSVNGGGQGKIEPVQNTGGGGSHPNIQRTLVGYLWKRTA